MKIVRILVPLWALLILNATLSANFISKTSQNDQKLSNYVCKITKDITTSKTDAQDVLIGNLGGKIWSSTINEIAGCVGHDSAVIVGNFEVSLREKTLRKAAVIVLALGWANQNTIISIVRTHIHSRVWNHKAKVMILVKSSLNINQRLQILKMLMTYGFIDSTIVHEKNNDAVIFEVFFTMKSGLRVLTNPEETGLIFPDKLKNMKGYIYNIMAYNQVPRVIVNSNSVSSTLIPFIDAVTEQQNARYRIFILNDLRDVKRHWMDRNFHLSLSYGVFMYSDEPKLLTYEESSYCALVPMPPKVPLFQSIFIEPFDGLTWLFFVLTMACCVAVWWLFRNLGAVDSPWLLGYGMFVMFIGQGVDFSRRNRLVLAILLQLIIVMIWILNQAYEGVITSLMIQPIQENRLVTFDDLTASDYEIMTDSHFALTISGSEAYQVLKPRLNTSAVEMGDNYHLELARQHYVFIMTCDQIEVSLPLKVQRSSKTVSELYYMLPQKFLPFLIHLEASYLNPFIERFQYFMDLCFQAGLMHIWDVFESFEHPYKTTIHSTKELEYLKLEDLSQVFGILVIGYVLSTMLFLAEIFFYDILKKLKLANFALKLKSRVHQLAYKKRKQPKHPKYQKGAFYYIIHRRKRVKRLKARKLKVRSIYVQPIFPMD